MVFEFARQVSIIGSQVEMPVSAVSYQNCLCLTGFFALEGFINGYFQIMAWLRAGNNSLGASKLYAGLKDGSLMRSDGLNQA
jgi:hypothetical protein